MHSDKTCAICGFADARGLTQVKFLDKTSLIVCGTHALMVNREPVGDAQAFRIMVADRRLKVERRGTAQDELASSLTRAFSGERRRRERRTAP